MKNRENQVYEDYWNYTAAFTDFDSLKFRNVLKACLDFLDGIANHLNYLKGF